MKNLLLAILLVFSMLACSKNNDNQEQHISASQVPTAVMTTYTSRYPAASGQVEWELEHGNTYKVKFFIGNQRWQAQFTSAGIFIDEQMI